MYDISFSYSYEINSLMSNISWSKNFNKFGWIKFKNLKVLLDVVQTYEKEQVERYKKADNKEREKASDLILLLEILTNALNRRNRPVNLLTGSSFFLILLIKIYNWNLGYRKKTIFFTNH